MLRVIAGSAKGHQLKVASGGVTRPATDLVRGAIFSMLENMTDDWSRVLDLYSGSGAMGIEALSRGADWADFVERDPRCCAIIRQNLEKTRLADRAHLYCQRVEKALTFLDKTYSIVLTDPPYADDSIDAIVMKLAASPIVGDETIVVVTHTPRRVLQAEYGRLKLLKERRHGDSSISIYRKGD